MATYDYSNERCPGCPGNTPLIEGDGPRSCRVFCVGESPGPEDREGDRTLFGKSGREYNEHYLPLAGLHRDQIYVTNTVKCHISRGDKKPSPELVRDCADFHLRSELRLVTPEIIVTMGATAASLVKDSIQLDLEHGFPRTSSILGYKATIMPMIHPSSGMHDGKNITLLRNDFKTLKDVLRGTYRPLRDEYPSPKYYHLTTPDEVSFAFKRGASLAIDTESSPSFTGKWLPWCLTFAQGPYEGYLIKFDATKTIRRFAQLMNRHDTHITMQNHPHDVPVLESQSIPINMELVRDTMVRAYHLGNGTPQGLKAMAYRILGSRMLDFEDLVNPYWRIYAEEYLRRLSRIEWPKETPQEITDEKGTRMYRPQNLNTKLKRLFTDLRKKDAKEDDILKRFWDWPDSQRDAAVERFGHMPRPSVALCPFDEVLDYACHDAVNTWRLGEILFARKVRLQAA